MSIWHGRGDSVPQLDLQRASESAFDSLLISQIQGQEDGLVDVKAGHIQSFHLRSLHLGNTSTILVLGLVQRNELGVVGLAEELEFEIKKRGFTLTTNIEREVQKLLAIGKNDLYEVQSEDLLVTDCL